MKNIKTKILLLAILAVIGIGLVMLAYFMQTSGTFSGKNKETLSGQEDAGKGIAIILNVKEENANLSEQGTAGELKAGSETFGGETSEDAKNAVENAPAPGEFAVLKSNLQGDGGGGNESLTGQGYGGGGSEPAPLRATGGLEERAAADRYDSETVNATAVETGPETQNAPPSLESLKQNITSSLNVVVVDKGKVVSNKTVNIENQQSG